MTIRFVVNGTPAQVEADGDVSLLTLLCDDLGLTGSKYGCGEGECGACTVLVDGEAVRSCVLDASTVAGKTVLTIEGLERDGRLHPLQQSFLDEGAFQCGYCTPGMIMSALGLINQHQKPSGEQIVEAMQGNICRCGGYPRIMRAIHRAAAAMERES